jgi:hypothetical protein
MRFQTRLIAVLWSLNFFTGVTPGRLFQMATSLSAGQALASCANSCSLVKLSNGVAVAAAAASGVPCAVMLTHRVDVPCRDSHRPFRMLEFFTKGCDKMRRF